MTNMADFTFPGQWIKDGMVLGPQFKAETVDKLETYDMSDGDVLIASYPKTGAV